MILAIDVGNTNIVLGMIENGEIQNVVRIHTDLRETGTEYAITLRQVTDFYWMSTVSPSKGSRGRSVPRSCPRSRSRCALQWSALSARSR